MVELPTVLALSGMLARAYAQDPAGWVNSVCFPSGQLQNILPYPCPGIPRVKAECSKYLTSSIPSPEELKDHRDCMCFGEKIIQFEKGCTACKREHAFLGNIDEGYWNGILDRVNQTYCYAPTPTAAYDVMWQSASAAAGPAPTPGPGNELINYAKDMPPNSKTMVELYWNGTTAEGSVTSIPTGMMTITTTPSTASDDDSCAQEAPLFPGPAALATSTTTSPSAANLNNATPTVINMNDDWIYVSAKQEVPGEAETSTVRPLRPSQSAWTQPNQTAATSQAVSTSRTPGHATVVRVCLKCIYVRDETDFKLACAPPMEVDGTKKEIPQHEAEMMPSVPSGLPNEPASVEQRGEVTIPNTIIQEVCKCSYNGNSKTYGPNPGSSKNPGSSIDDSNPGNPKNPGSSTSGSDTDNPDIGGSATGSSKNPGSSMDGSKTDSSNTGRSGSVPSQTSGVDGSARPPSHTNGTNQPPIVTSASAGIMPKPKAMILVAMALLI